MARRENTPSGAQRRGTAGGRARHAAGAAQRRAAGRATAGGPFPDPSRLPGARRAKRPPDFVPPELATLVKEAPQGDSWLHEIKFDGFRTLARIEQNSVTMYSRNGKDWTEHYPVLVSELAALPVKTALLDGEVVARLIDGTTSFEKLTETLGSGRPAGGPRGSGGGPGRRGAAPAGPGAGGDADAGGRLLYYVFDLLHLDGFDLVDVALEERRRLLEHVLAGAGAAGSVQFSENIRGDGRAVLEEACRLGLEGVVSKKTASPYRAGARGTDWVKSKCRRRQEFVIGGYTDPAGSRAGFGALLLGVYGPGGLRYAGRVGTGFDERVLRSLGARLQTLETDGPPFVQTPAGSRPPGRGIHWVKPQLVAEVEFMEWTAAGSLRHPSFVGLREDKSPEDVVEERAESTW